VQYLLGGLSPESYTAAVGGTAVSGSPFTVSANDDSIEFLGGAGIVSVTSGSLPGPSTSSVISGQAGVSGNVIIH
jgi:hypothetical protein